MSLLQRYFVPKDYWTNNQVVIDGDDVHHIVRVMRLDLGDQLICVHPEGKIAHCKIVEINKQITCEIQSWDYTNRELPVQVTLLQALPKGQQLDFIIQKGTELGASKFTLFTADRSVTKWDHKRASKRLSRYSRIAKEASEQSERNNIPHITFEERLATALTKLKNKPIIKLFAYETMARKNSQDQHNLSHYLSQAKKGDEFIICIGPEGGFTKNEVNLLLAEDFKPIRLGRRILRTETASLYAMSNISYHFEEMERD